MFHYYFRIFIFKIDNKQKEATLQKLKEKAKPKIELKCTVIKAKDFKAMNSDGLADPFVTMYIVSKNEMGNKVETSVKPDTLKPIWEEDFSL